MRWPRKLADRIGVEHPIFLAPMAGVSTPALVAAVSDAGGLGAFGFGALPAPAIAEALRAAKAITSRPIGANLFAPEPHPAPPPPADDVARARDALAPIRAELGLPADPPPAPAATFEEQLRAVLDGRVAVFSFTFGALAPEDVAAIARTGAVVMGTATSVAEARALAASGVDAVVAQGAEAGGHRGTFLGPVEHGLTGTLALVPQVVDAVAVPVVAAGGIMDGRAIAAAFALGAQAVSLGTAFLACPESGASAPHKAAVLAPRDHEATTLTRAFSGRHARGLRNRFTEAMACAPALPFPFQNALTSDLRRAAAAAGKAEYLSLWAGQAAPLARALPAGDLLRALVAEAEAAAARLA